jgi:hypothetical protein
MTVEEMNNYLKAQVTQAIANRKAEEDAKSSSSKKSNFFNWDICRNLGKYKLVLIADEQGRLYKELQDIQHISISQDIAKSLAIPSWANFVDGKYYQQEEYKNAYSQLFATTNLIADPKYTQILTDNHIMYYKKAYTFVFYAKIISATNNDDQKFKDPNGNPYQLDGTVFSLLCKSKSIISPFFDCLNDAQEELGDQALIQLAGRSNTTRDKYIVIKTKRPQFYEFNISLKSTKDPITLTEEDLTRSKDLSLAYIDTTCSSTKVEDILALNEYLKNTILK